MRFKKGLFYKHDNCKDIIIRVLWAGYYNNVHKLKIEYWNISPRDKEPWYMHVNDRVKISADNAIFWHKYIVPPDLYYIDNR